MKKKHTILEILLPKVRAEIFRLLFMPPFRERYVRELMAMSGLRLSTVQDELRKLSVLQCVTNRYGRSRRFYRANKAHSLFRDIVHIVETSDRTPEFDRSLLHRPRPLRRTGHRKSHRFRRDPIHWGIFSKPDR